MQSGVQQGYLLLADISGYTSFMAETELEHSQEIMSELLNLVIEQFTPTMQLAEVEGDAVFFHAQQASIQRGETVLELVESAYVAFRNQLTSMKRLTTCECRACQAIPRLDLKFITHFGTYALQHVAGKTKPVGSDVNLVHRLLKNGVSEKTGWQAYALFSKHTLEQMGISPTDMHTSTETYEHLGEIRTESLDLSKRYRELTEERRVVVSEEAADKTFTQQIPMAPAIVWEWLNDPARRTQYMTGVTWSTGERPAGRVGTGAINHCAHGKSSMAEHILDWRPFNYFTIEGKGGGLLYRRTTQLVPDGDGTRVYSHWRLEAPLPRWILRPIARLLLTKVFKVPDSMAQMEKLMAESESRQKQTAVVSEMAEVTS